MSSDVAQSQTKASRIVRDDDCLIIAAAPYADDIQCSWFDPATWGANAKPVSSGGRGTAWFVQNGDERWVLRHYSRGGLVAKVSHKGYLYSGQKRVRSYSEFLLLDDLYKAGLPVPRPIAAAYWRRSPLSYRAAIFIDQVQGSVPFADLLQEADSVLWSEIGKTIRNFHDYGVDHTDLNCHNLLVDDQGIFLIDFDKCRIRNGLKNSRWKNRNLSRLKRSVEKIYPESLPMWKHLIDGYQA